MSQRYATPHSSSPAPNTTLPATLSHFAIFNPSLRPTLVVVDPEAERDKDEEDDVREAAQILFYTSREAGGVSRDRMLRQVGLAKGLMGFADMLAKEDTKYWSIHSHRSRLLLYSPEPEFFIYICITLAHTPEKKDPTPAAQGIADQVLVDALARGYEDFQLLYGPLPTHVPPTASTSSLIEKYFTRFALNFESTLITSPPSISAYLGGFPASPAPDIDAAASAFFTELDSASQLYIVGKDGPLSVQGGPADPALLRYLFQLVQSSLPPPYIPDKAPTTKSDSRQTLGFGLSGLGLGRKKKDDPKNNPQDDQRKASWMTVTLGGWVPDLRRVSGPAPSVGSQAGKDGAAQPIDETEGKGPVPAPPQSGTSPSQDGWNKWGFGLGGLGGLGEAVGSVGTVFGLGGGGSNKESGEGPEEVKAGGEELREEQVTSAESEEAEEDESTPTVEQRSVLPPSDHESTDDKPASIPLPPSTRSSISEDVSALLPAEVHLEPSNSSLPELGEAVEEAVGEAVEEAVGEAVEQAVELEWDSRVVWVPRADSFEETRLCWIIRDNTLISIVLRDKSAQPYPLPSTQATLELFSQIASASTTATPVPEVQLASNAWIGKIGEYTVEKQGEMDEGTAQTMVELRGVLKSFSAVTEIFAKVSTSRFVVAKKSAQSELYLLVGKKDTSLTDAGHAVRGLLRSRPELGG